MSELLLFLEVVCGNSKIHVSVHDTSGILSCEKLVIDFNYTVHSKPICDGAKSTVRGLDLCMRCKALANKKAIETKKPFCGYCPIGIFEAAYPVVVDGEVFCIVYAGNVIADSERFAKSIKRTCKITGVNPQSLDTEQCEINTDTELVKKTAAVTANYIKGIIKENRYHRSISRNACGWVVGSICGHIENYYCNKLTLKSLARLYFMNEKYLGRIFKKETGKSFNQYLNEVRLGKAYELLLTTDKSVLEIALDCGYGNVSYFNRLCMQKYGMSPTEIRRNFI